MLPSNSASRGPLALRTVIHTFKLLLPALVPSWRFFDGIAPSPRVEYALLRSAGETAAEWRAFQPRPARVSFFRMLRRMVWNPSWNEQLFLVSCAERLIDYPTDHSAREIFSRVAAGLARTGADLEAFPYLQFRLVFLSRQEDALHKEVLFVSPVELIGGGGGP